MENVKCPYCGTDQEIIHDDGYGIEEGKIHHQQCGHCNKNFAYMTTIILYYDVVEAECLNEGEHKWQPTHTFPVELTEMHCTVCGERRMPSDEEKIQFNLIPSGQAVDAKTVK